MGIQAPLKAPEVTPAMLAAARTVWLIDSAGKEIQVPPETAALLWGVMWQAYLAKTN